MAKEIKVIPVDFKKHYGKSIAELLGYTNVTKHTRAGKKGKEIVCPKCDNPVLVYHFSWSAMTCEICKEDIDKYNWKTLNR